VSVPQDDIFGAPTAVDDPDSFGDFGDFGGFGDNDGRDGDFGDFGDPTDAANGAPGDDATGPSDKMAKLRSAFVSDNDVAAPFSSSSDGTIGVDASFVGFGDPAGDTLGGSTGFVEDGSDFGALNNDGGGMEVDADARLAELIREERLDEALEVVGAGAIRLEYAAAQQQLVAKQAEYVRLKEEDALQDALDCQKEAQEMEEALTMMANPVLSAYLGPPPPGHVTMAQMRATIQTKCDLDKAASFAEHFPTPLSDIAAQDLLLARDMQRDAIRWVRTLSLFQPEELERYGQAWCLSMHKARAKMTQAMAGATAVANAVVSEEDAVVKQAAQSPQLANFVKGAEALFRTALKIEAACNAHPFCASGTSLEETRNIAAEIHTMWMTFRSVVATIGLEVEEVEIDAKGCWQTSDNLTSGDWLSCCALTLLPIALGTTESTVTWKGRRYLTSSANFWLHCVSDTPPYQLAQPIRSAMSA